jgi:hypothetical protein
MAGSLGDVKDISIIVAGVVALIGLFSGMAEYVRRGRQERTQHFLDLRRRFLENDRFRTMLDLLAVDSPDLARVPRQDRRNLVGFLEEVALLVDAKMLDADVAHYMFGYYVRLAAKSKHLWTDMDPDSTYWRVFREFAASMERRASKG